MPRVLNLNPHPPRRMAHPASGTGSRLQPARTEPKNRIGWGRILKNVYRETNRDNVSVMAAGVAFWTFLSIFPGCRR